MPDKRACKLLQLTGCRDVAYADVIRKGSTISISRNAESR